MKQLRLIISKIEQQPNDIVVYELEPDRPVSFVPGQFMSIELMIQGKPVRRSYSLCNSPYTNEPLTIAVKRIDNGEVSRELQDNYVAGDTLTGYEPAGLFQYHYQTEFPRDIILIGAGSGITPLISILKSALLKEPQSTVTLIYSNHSPETTLFYEQLQDLRQQYTGRFNCFFLWSNSKKIQYARLNRDLLLQLVERNMVYPMASALVYTCGPADYMLLSRLVLTGMGFLAEQLKKETFVLPEDEADDDDGTLSDPILTDQHTYTVQLYFEQHHYRLEVPYTQSILDTALERGIHLPYSCKAGMCGTCAALCIKGDIRMRYNEVLTDNETARGRVLLCTAHPLGNDVEVAVN
jgi:ring-1,2-phenylacetyl-CoA epoxidase subunit PaaE